MVKHIQTIRRLPTNFLSVFDHFVGLVLQGLTYFRRSTIPQRIFMLVNHSTKTLSPIKNNLVHRQNKFYPIRLCNGQECNE